jgi:hypothetical protein
MEGNLLCGTDLHYNFQEEVYEVCGGTEYNLGVTENAAVALRAGIKTKNIEPETSLSVGAGINLALELVSAVIDYAYTTDRDTKLDSATHRISFSIRF